MDITTGMVIISAAGHDKEQWFLVTGIDGRYAYLADGKERKLAAPKKKNLKHVRATGQALSADGMTDKRLRTALRGLSRSIAEESE